MSFDNEDRKFARKRNQLVEHLRSKGIEDESVLTAIGTVPRHLFVEQAFQQRAYEDEALPIGLKQTISQPYTVAYQSAMLGIKKNDRVLEIGTGSGYQAAILYKLGARVFSIERHEALHARAKKILQQLRYQVTMKHGDGTLGWATFAPYDKILVTAGAQGIPESILDQLRKPDEKRKGGCLVIPVGEKEQTMYKVTCTGEGSYDYEKTSSFRFVPLIGDGKTRTPKPGSTLGTTL